MRIELHILNPELFKESETKNAPAREMAMWRSKRKVYESEQMDEDMIVSPIGNRIDRIIMNDCQITSTSQVDGLIKFLENAKKSLKH